jgi:MFS superfamily sulfate permease-like transporter
MSKILIGIVFALSMALAFFYYQNKSLTALNQAYEVRDAEQKAAIESLQNDFELQTSGLLQLQSRNQEIESEMNRYLDIFRRHDLSKLAAARPGMIEPRINNGTKEVFESIEEDSRDIDSLDSGVQLQPNTE